MEPVVHIEGLTFGYTSRSPLFQELSLSLRPGEVAGLLGENGAGKTTLLKLIAGELFPDEGVGEVFGIPSERRDPSVLARLWFLPEELPSYSIPAEDYACSTGAFYPGYRHDELLDLCDQLEVDVRQKLTRLSYGQQKKFFLAFALATGVPLLLLDEPTNGLDIPSKRQVRRLIPRYAAEGRTFLISTHQVRDLEHLIDPVIILHKGRIVLHASMDELQERLSFVVLPEAPPDALYVEKVPGGYGAILPGGGKGEVDLELLFDAARSRESELPRIWRKEELV
ncbi:ATP-binding cassette domain-containing protein [Spirochaeta thermophila]|uniref:ABC transporter ATP binding protein n=1 Tax=Winmispira thermophila (strain ATCC 49972 / DSM 6192 / RI 19.B1) TaxID=665571 RepID=E0RU80_WINT6|nr:ABC transporter ATP-binding protein [Spirochaeta thermophila]ADN02301.1 ABC transporter ATP binding protein [Spirochaeta thermophila DSM 6192]